MIYVIGAGGTGSWTVPILRKLCPHADIAIVDGDILEEKNISRQQFTPDDIGQPKARVLARRYDCEYIAEWYSAGRVPIAATGWLLVCADNNAARTAALSDADRSGCQVVIAGNEAQSAEAYYYKRAWRGTALDPEIFYPELITNPGDDPLARGMGCTAQIALGNVQHALANFTAATLLMNLFDTWRNLMPKLKSAESRDMLPYHILSMMPSITIKTVNQTMKGQT